MTSATPVEADRGMIPLLIPNFDADGSPLVEIATGGYVLGFGLSWKGPEHLVTTFSPAWRAIYEQKNLYHADPILMWGLTSNGAKRWSAVRFPDPLGVNRLAGEYGLRFGAMFSRKSSGRRSFLSVTRPDRELTDSEIEVLHTLFKTWVEIVMDKATLSDGELSVLRCFRDGMAQRETAELLNLSESAVKARAIKAQGKLDAKTRTQAVAIAMSRGYFD